MEKLIANNKKARHDYFFEDTYEAGVALTGTEIKSVRAGGVVYINGEAQIEGYTKDGYTNTELEETYVPEGKLFCMGDNRQNSRDSRDSAIGLVDYDAVLGKAVFRLFPFSRIGGLY